FALARYNPDGSLDSTFGTGGKVTTDFGGNDNARAVTIQHDGKIVAAGEAFCCSLPTEVFALARYLGGP
ncbi:MAG TPA: delta-60 repeat domain-containing protein, partial [Candidatus Acidoferrales bacterium]|nr:delta-60 repeat domain-containing protein [Candidatus Acidoferrales bacterium]